MSSKSKSTVRMLCVASDTVMRRELPEEAQRLLDIYNDPDVDPAQKEIAKRQLDDAIRKLEDRVTTRKLNEKNGPSLPPGP